MKIDRGSEKVVMVLLAKGSFPLLDEPHFGASRQYSYSALPRSAASLRWMVFRSALVTSVVGPVGVVQTSMQVTWAQLYQLVGLAVCDQH